MTIFSNRARFDKYASIHLLAVFLSEFFQRVLYFGNLVLIVLFFGVRKGFQVQQLRLFRVPNIQSEELARLCLPWRRGRAEHDKAATLIVVRIRDYTEIPCENGGPKVIAGAVLD